MRQNTPWGRPQHERILAEGIISYSTATHGGIWLSKDRQAQLGYADNWLKDPAWWEEDCDWAVPYVAFRDDIQAHGTAFKFNENLSAAWRTIENYHHAFFARFQKAA